MYYPKPEITTEIYTTYSSPVTPLPPRTELEWYYLSGIAAVNLLGYIMYRGANSMKHAFRTNPSSPALASTCTCIGGEM